MNNTGFVCIVFIVLGSIFLHTWILQGFWADGSIKDNPKEEKDIYEKIVEGTTYSQSFYHLGNEFTKVSMRFGDCPKMAGTISYQLRDSAGNLLAEKTRKLNGDSNGFKPIGIPLEGINVSFGEQYSITFTVDLEDGVDFISLRCSKPTLFKTHMYANGTKQTLRMNLTYSVEQHFQVILIPVAIILVLVILGLSFIRGKLKVLFAPYAIISALLLPTLGYFAIEWMNKGYPGSSWVHVFANALPLLWIYLLVLAICNSVHITNLITLGLYFFIGIATTYVTLFRDRPLLPWDLTAMKTAATVAGDYTYVGQGAILISALSLFVIVIACSRFTEKKHSKWIYRVSSLILLIATISIYNQRILPTIPAELWDIKSNYKVQGTPASFIKYSTLMSFNEPEGYDQAACAATLNNQEMISATSHTKATNVIIIMNESLSDLRIIGDLPGDYMPFMDSLSENTIKGNLYVPTYGGGTANTEFEVLTGASCTYVPGIPYQMYVNDTINSICTTMKSNAFSTVTFHPNKAVNYNRNVVYPRLGFDTFYSIKDMIAPDWIRHYVSDVSNYDFVIQHDEQNQDTPYFMFNVTMQNHASYTDENGPFVDLSSYGNFPLAEQYLALIKESDSAFEKLVSHYKNIDEPTIICMFGDHQVAIEDSFYELLYGKSLGNLTPEEAQKRMVTPFIIWTNYDIEETYVDKLSSNFLYPLILQTAGYDLIGYDAYLKSVSETYPVISPYGCYDKDGNFYTSVDSIGDSMLTEYKYMQYYRMTGN